MFSLLKRTKIVGAAVVSFDGVILDCNDEFARIQGDDVVHLIGKNVVDLTSPEDRDRARINLAKLSSGSSGSIQHDKHYLGRSGQTIGCRCQFLAVRETDEPHIVSIIYEYDSNDSHIERIAKLEDYVAKLLEVIAKSQGVQIMTGDNNSQNADRGGQIANTSTVNQSRVMVAIIISGAMCLVALAALVFSGSVSFSNGQQQIEIHGKDDPSD